MIGDEFAAARAIMGLSRRQLADMLKCGEASLRRWENDENSIPAPVARWMMRCARFHLKNPPPTAWDKNRRVKK